MKKFLSYSDYKDINTLYRNIFTKMSENVEPITLENTGIKIPDSLVFIQQYGNFSKVYKLCEVILNSYNMSLTKDIVYMSTLVAVGNIYYVENMHNDPETIKDDLRFILEELKLNGVGNGIVKNISNILSSIANIYNYVFKTNIESFIQLYEKETKFISNFLNALSNSIDNKTDIETLSSKLTKISPMFITTDIQSLIDSLLNNDDIIKEDL